MARTASGRPAGTAQLCLTACKALPRRWKVAILLWAVLATFAVWTHSTGRCDMRDNLAQLQNRTLRVLDGGGVIFWLVYGSLLGFERHHDIIPWEFDNDYGLRRSQCDKVRELRNEFKKEGLDLYMHDDYMWFKAMWGYSGFQINTCARVVDPKTWWYTDLYWHEEVPVSVFLDPSASLAPGQRRPTRIPEGLDALDPDSTMICDAGGYGEDDMEMGCVPTSWIFPLRAATFAGAKVHVPAESTKVTALSFGADWNVVRSPKGYKVVLCHVPSVVMLTLVVPVAVFAWQLVKQRRKRTAGYQRVPII